jgi:hypothetical protein
LLVSVTLAPASSSLAALTVISPPCPGLVHALREVTLIFFRSHCGCRFSSGNTLADGQVGILRAQILARPLFIN